MPSQPSGTPISPSSVDLCVELAAGLAGLGTGDFGTAWLAAQSLRQAGAVMYPGVLEAGIWPSLQWIMGATFMRPAIFRRGCKFQRQQRYATTE